jgi:hypothetical protein
VIKQKNIEREMYVAKEEPGRMKEERLVDQENVILIICLSSMWCHRRVVDPKRQLKHRV